VVQKLGGGRTTYALDYDTNRASFKPKLGLGAKAIRFSAAGAGSDDGVDADWSLRVSGSEGNHFSVTTDGGEVVYEGALTHERQIAEKLSALYAVDAKRRRADKGLGGLLPGWLRNSLGLRYSSAFGDVKVNAYQEPEAKTGVTVRAIYQGDLANITLREMPGSPTVALAVGPNPDADGLAYAGTLKVKGPMGVRGSLNVRNQQGETQVSAHANLAGEKEVREGLKVSANTQVLAAPGALGAAVELAPVEVKATADLGTLAEKYLNKGSTLTAVARHKVGEAQPQLGLAAIVDAKPIGPLKLGAAARLFGGQLLGKLDASATVGNVATSYKVTKVAQGEQQAALHVASATWPAERKADSSGRMQPQLYGRVTQNPQDHGGKPRLQLGMVYDLSKGGAKISGASNAFDSGSSLVDDEGQPWQPAMFIQARERAHSMRQHVSSNAAEGQRWLGGREGAGPSGDGPTQRAFGRAFEHVTFEEAGPCPLPSPLPMLLLLLLLSLPPPPPWRSRGGARPFFQ